MLQQFNYMGSFNENFTMTGNERLDDLRLQLPAVVLEHHRNVGRVQQRLPEDQREIFCGHEVAMLLAGNTGKIKQK